MPWSDYITAPTSHRLNLERAGNLAARGQYALTQNTATFRLLDQIGTTNHPDFGHLCLLVFEAVLEVVCVSLPGYIVARQGMFDAEAQKFVANLNVMLFTPCLIFTKLASQLTADKLVDLAIIPFIFACQTLVSFICAWVISKLMGFKKRQKSFVIAMGVFGNSNSLPISLVMSLSKTITGLHWRKVPGDNDDEVAARGILYLLIFQQLGQLLRWTWGYNVLLAPADRFTEEEGGTARSAEAERGRGSYRDEVAEQERQRLLSPAESDEYDSNLDDEPTRVANSPDGTRSKSRERLANTGSSQASSDDTLTGSPTHGNILPHDLGTSRSPSRSTHDEDAGGLTGFTNKVRNRVNSAKEKSRERLAKTSASASRKIPNFIKKPVGAVWRGTRRFLGGVWEFMNPPLWAMLVAIIVASVPALQELFFAEGSFVRNSVTRAIASNGNVAVPLILVVLGGNLARNTLPKNERPGEALDPSEERKLLIASLISRMLLPTIIMAPLLAITARFVPVSILDDKIFIIVAFLLTGAPSALQLAQICQINNVYMSVMSNILFQGYVIWILPSTLLLVMLALESNEWAEQRNS